MNTNKWTASWMNLWKSVTLSWKLHEPKLIFHNFYMFAMIQRYHGQHLSTFCCTYRNENKWSEYPASFSFWPPNFSSLFFQEKFKLKLKSSKWLKQFVVNENLLIFGTNWIRNESDDRSDLIDTNKSTVVHFGNWSYILEKNWKCNANVPVSKWLSLYTSKQKYIREHSFVRSFVWWDLLYQLIDANR